MKILCVIDSLSPGGAQRQMVNLACGLKANGHTVELCVYYPELNFFRDEINQAGIKIYDIYKKSRYSLNVIFKIAILIKNEKYDGIISFLDTPNFYSAIAKIISLSSTFLIVSERSSRIYSKNKKFRIQHLIANKIVANSFDHGKWLMSFPNLKKKVNVIYNGYELKDRIQSNPNIFNKEFLVIGRIDSNKNGLNLIRALIKLSKKTHHSLSVKWAGMEVNDPKSLLYRQQMEDLLTDNSEVSNRWEWLGHRKDIYELLESADALIHVSFYEGLPNAICEAFIAGRPVIASNVCDHPLLVEDNVRGILCDPLSVDSISAAIERFVNLIPEERQKMGINVRRYAEQNLSAYRMVSEYQKLLNSN